MRHHLWAVSIVIGNIDLAVAAMGFAFESNFGLGDAWLLRDRHSNVVRQRMRLRAQRAAGVGLG